MALQLSVKLTPDADETDRQAGVIQNVLAFFDERIPCGPPLGRCQVDIYLRHDYPCTQIVGDPPVYRIGLKVRAGGYPKLVYQFAHETCHVYANPRVANNWLYQTICEMASQAALDWMAVRRGTGHCPSTFGRYLLGWLGEAHRKEGIAPLKASESELAEWMSAKRMTLSDGNKWERNAVLAELLLGRVFRRHIRSWLILPHLRKGSVVPQRGVDGFSFPALEEAVAGELKQTVRAAHNALVRLVDDTAHAGDADE